ncbi:cutinase [Xylariomycetidae sp. FL2044]|nr:cutinase [Xylariomycetidae sp. FL2044]
MKSFIAVLSLAALAAANPIVIKETTGTVPILAKRQTGPIAKEFSQGGCRDNIFIFSRGSTEIGNMGTIAGPPTSDGLKKALGGDDAVATEGVDYGALLSTNFLPGGADLAGISTMKDLINDAASQCPDSTLLVGGYSQGAAMVHRVVEDLDPDVQDQIAGVVTFGDTQNTQDKGAINNFDSADKLKVICNDGDAVCDGTLTILPPHLDYTRRADEAVDFLAGKAQDAAAKRKAKRGLLL